jgi:hypothetical protein
MTIIVLLRWSLGRGNPVVPSRWQATPGHGKATGLDSRWHRRSGDARRGSGKPNSLLIDLMVP